MARDETAGRMPVSEYPDRKAGGRWYAMGDRYPADHDDARSPYYQYRLSGEAGGSIECLPGARSVALYDYDTDDRVLGRTHSVYHLAADSCESRENAIKLLYAVYRDDEHLLSGLSRRTLENVDVFLNLDYLERDSGGKLKLKIPVLSEEDRKAFFGLVNQYADKLLEAFRGEYAGMIRNPVEVPKHLRNDVPEFLRYMHPCFFSTALMSEARKRGRFLKDCEGTVPAVLMIVAEE